MFLLALANISCILHYVSLDFFVSSSIFILMGYPSLQGRSRSLSMASLVKFKFSGRAKHLVSNLVIVLDKKDKFAILFLKSFFRTDELNNRQAYSMVAEAGPTLDIMTFIFIFSKLVFLRLSPAILSCYDWSRG